MPSLSKKQKESISNLVNMARIMKPYELEGFRERLSDTDGDTTIRDEVIKQVDAMLEVSNSV